VDQIFLACSLDDERPETCALRCFSRLPAVSLLPIRRLQINALHVVAPLSISPACAAPAPFSRRLAHLRSWPTPSTPPKAWRGTTYSRPVLPALEPVVGAPAAGVCFRTLTELPPLLVLSLQRMPLPSPTPPSQPGQEPPSHHWIRLSPNDELMLPSLLLPS
jgi:hypothetical protein